jgi:type III pantothenate kinase
LVIKKEASKSITMYLLIDWGNTQLKAILLESLDPVIADFNEVSSVSLGTPEALVDWLELHTNNQQLESILIASVREDLHTQQLIKLLEPICKNHYIAKTSVLSAGVRCAYQDPSALGIDRWLGVLAGYTKDQTTAVIDIGSAITVDVVNSQGYHIGGHIVPGEQLIKNSLKQTGKVLAEKLEQHKEGFQLGVTTGECVDFGVQQLLEGYLHSVIFNLKKHYQVESWVFTGGGGLFWKQRLQSVNDIINDKNANFQPNIVFSGLVTDFLEKTDRAQYSRD